MLWKCCTQYGSQSGKVISGHRTGKGPFSFQSQRKAIPKNVQTTAQLHSSHTLAKECSKLSRPGFNSAWTMNFQMFKLDLEKAEEPETKLPTSTGSSKKQEKHLFLLYWLCQSLWLCGSQQILENSWRNGNNRSPDLPLEKSVCRSASNSENYAWNNRRVPNRERSTSSLYIVILFI